MIARALGEYALWMALAILVAIALVALVGLGAFLFLFVDHLLATLVYGALLFVLARWWLRNAPKVSFM